MKIEIELRSPRGKHCSIYQNDFHDEIAALDLTIDNKNTPEWQRSALLGVRSIIVGIMKKFPHMDYCCPEHLGK